MNRLLATLGILLPVIHASANQRLTDMVDVPKPTWETQKQARTYLLRIPAPRGQITDRNGKPLAKPIRKMKMRRLSQ